MFSILVCFVLPLLSYFRVNLVGEVSLTEGVLIIYGLLNIRKFVRMWADKRVKWVVLLALAWLVMAIVSDFYRQTPKEDFLRGWARIIVLIWSIFSIGNLVWDDRNKIVAFAMGQFCSIGLYYLVYGSDLPLYKFIVGFSVSGAAFCLAARLEAANTAIARLIPFGAGALAFFNNARSLAGITLIAAFYPYIYYSNKIRTKLFTPAVVIPMVVLLIGGLGLLQFYKFGASSGLLGEEALQKYSEQVSATTGDFSIIDGRGEIFFSWPKIRESPIIGWGSWARDLQFVMDRQAQLGLKDTGGDRVIPDLIPAHSHFFGAWLEAGIVGGLFWLLVLALIIQVFLSNAMAFMGKFRAFGVFMMNLFFWDILFSPFGGERRVDVAAELADVQVLIGIVQLAVAFFNEVHAL